MLSMMIFGRFSSFPLILSLLVVAATAFAPWQSSISEVRRSQRLRPLRSSTLQEEEVKIGQDDIISTDESDQKIERYNKKSVSLPGLDEAAIFEDDESVEFWREFQRNGLAPTEQNARDIAAVASRFVALGPEATSYFARHAARSGYFIGNALLGNAAFQLSERFANGGDDALTTILPLNLNDAAASRLILEAFLSFEQDYQAIRAGLYREPWDMASIRHRQSSPVNVVRQTGRFVQEAMGTIGRRKRSKEEDKDVSFFHENNEAIYPDYYKTAFHFQGDGWMSERSANVYETSTETLFLGRQDAMQRTSLPPLISLSRKLQRPMRVLEVACGTGRFMTFVRDNLPLKTEYTAIDLSPFYLEKARDNDSYWRQTKVSEGIATKIPPAKCIQARAESLPFDDNSFDAVLCVYLFHEIPRDVRERVTQEMARVVAPGGTVVLTDSIQRGDRPVLDDALVYFEEMNEPYYRDYINDYLPNHFERVGLRPLTKTVRSTTKSLSFQKPKE